MHLTYSECRGQQDPPGKHPSHIQYAQQSQMRHRRNIIQRRPVLSALLYNTLHTRSIQHGRMMGKMINYNHSDKPMKRIVASLNPASLTTPHLRAMPVKSTGPDIYTDVSVQMLQLSSVAMALVACSLQIAIYL